MSEPVLLQRKLKHVLSLSLRNISLPSAPSPPLYDSFFALKSLLSDTPFHISEICSSSSSADFLDLNLERYSLKQGPSYEYLRQLRSFQLTVFVRHASRWHKLFDRTVRLSSLRYLGKTLELSRTTRPNLILIIFKDGVYEVPLYTIPELKEKLANVLAEPLSIDTEPKKGVPIASYDNLLKLNNVLLCVLDIRRIRYQLVATIDAALDEKNRSKTTNDLLDILLRTRILASNISSFERIIKESQKRISSLRDKLERRTKELQRLKLMVYDEESPQNQPYIEDGNRVDLIKFEYDKARSKHNSLLDSLDAHIEALTAACDHHDRHLQVKTREIEIETARVFQTLQTIFSISPCEKNPIEFEILGLKLSNLCHFIKYPKYSQHEHSDEEDSIRMLSKDDLQLEIDTALGYTAQIVDALALYLQVPLKYPLIRFGSYSFICDYVSHLTSNNRIFPLHLTLRAGFAGSRRTILFKFEYGVSLLNKNIEQLMASQKLKVPDPHNILGNLKMLMLYVASKNMPYQA